MKQATSDESQTGHLGYLLTAYLFDNLSAAGKQEVESHLATCDQCQKELAQLRLTLGAAEQALDAGGKEYAFEERRRKRILQAARASRNSLWGRHPGLRLAVWIGGGLAASFLLMTMAGLQPMGREITLSEADSATVSVSELSPRPDYSRSAGRGEKHTRTFLDTSKSSNPLSWFWSEKSPAKSAPVAQAAPPRFAYEGVDAKHDAPKAAEEKVAGNYSGGRTETVTTDLAARSKNALDAIDEARTPALSLRRSTKVDLTKADEEGRINRLTVVPDSAVFAQPAAPATPAIAGTLYERRTLGEEDTSAKTVAEFAKPFESNRAAESKAEEKPFAFEPGSRRDPMAARRKPEIPAEVSPRPPGAAPAPRGEVAVNAPPPPPAPDAGGIQVQTVPTNGAVAADGMMPATTYAFSNNITGNAGGPAAGDKGLTIGGVTVPPPHRAVPPATPKPVVVQSVVKSPEREIVDYTISGDARDPVYKSEPAKPTLPAQRGVILDNIVRVEANAPTIDAPLGDGKAGNLASASIPDIEKGVAVQLAPETVTTTIIDIKPADSAEWKDAVLKSLEKKPDGFVAAFDGDLDESRDTALQLGTELAATKNAKDTGKDGAVANADEPVELGVLNKPQAGTAPSSQLRRVPAIVPGANADGSVALLEVNKETRRQVIDELKAKQALKEQQQATPAENQELLRDVRKYSDDLQKVKGAVLKQQQSVAANTNAGDNTAEKLAEVVDITVPSDVLAKAELADRFETTSADKPVRPNAAGGGVVLKRRENLSPSVELGIHDVSDLTSTIADFPGPRIDVDDKKTLADAKPAGPTAADVAKIVKERLGRDFEGAETSIEELGGRLVVMNRPEVQEKVKEVLKELKEQAEDKASFANRDEAGRLATETRVNGKRSVEKKIATLSDQAQALFETGKTDAARAMAQKILQLDPTNAEAQTIAATAGDSADAKRQGFLDEEYKERFGLARDGAERMNIPHSDYLVYPDNWHEIAARSSGKSEPEEPWKKELRKKLSRHVSFEFVDTPLEDVLKKINDLTGAGITLDHAVLAGGKGKTPINLKVTDMEAELALKWISRLAELDLDFYGGTAAIGKMPQSSVSADEQTLRGFRYLRSENDKLTFREYLRRPAPVPPPVFTDLGLDEDAYIERYGTRPFVDCARDNLSTFGMDVDTASYTQTRSKLRENKLPEADTVRVEEFLNYFKQPYTVAGDEAFGVFAEAAPSPFRSPPLTKGGQGGVSGSPTLQLLKIGIKSRDPRPDERKPAMLTFVIDTSGSMVRNNRLDMAREALKSLVQELAPDDAVAIIGFSSQAELLLPRTQARQKSRILDVLEALEPHGATNVEAGLNMAYRMADECFSAEAVNRVILCSDGVTNVGAQGPDEILKLVKVFAGRGIDLCTVGFGAGQYNDQMMARLADNGNGSCHFVDSADEARKVFHEQLPPHLNVLARDAKVQVDFNKDVVERYRLLGYEKRKIADKDFRNDKIDAGEVAHSTLVTVMYELLRKPASHGPLGKVFLRWKDAGYRHLPVVERNYPLSEGMIVSDVGNASPEFRFLACVARFAELLRASPWTRDSSYAAVLDQLNQLPPDFKARAEWKEVQELVSKAQELSVKQWRKEVQ